MHFWSTPLERTPGGLGLLSLDSAHAPFPFAGFNLYPFAAINQNLEYNKNKQKDKARATLYQAISQDCAPSKKPRGRGNVSIWSKSSLLTTYRFPKLIALPHNAAHCVPGIHMGPSMLPLWNLGGKKNLCIHDASAACWALYKIFSLSHRRLFSSASIHEIVTD